MQGSRGNVVSSGFIEYEHAKQAAVDKLHILTKTKTIHKGDFMVNT